MAAHYVQEIRAFQPEGSYVLGGYSFGALVAYEVARQLCSEGYRVALAASIDGYFPNNATHTRSEIAFLLRRMQFHLDNLMELGVGGAPRYVVDRLARRLARLAGKPSPAEPAPPSPPDLQTLPAVLREVFDINQRAAANYFPHPYPGRLTIFLARRLYGLGREQPRVPPSLAAGGVETHTVPGDHTTLMDEPHVQVLARKLRACLDRVIGSFGGLR